MKLPKQRNPYLAVDVLIVKNKKIVLIRRNKNPWKGKLSLPGGFVEWGETVEQAAIREAKEETGLNVKIKKLLGVYSNPKRDPRGHVVSIAFVAEPIKGKLKSSKEGEVNWYEINKEIFKYFGSKSDHKKMIKDLLKKSD
ncbi:MAG: NUDIX hydrolase [Candidatus Aenigmatarchaeota archaeon]